MTLRITLDRCGNIIQPAAFLGELDALEEALSGHIDQILSLRRDLAAGEGGCAVPMISSDIGAYINADDVTLLQHPGTRDTVDDLIVDTGADTAGECPDSRRAGKMEE